MFDLTQWNPFDEVFNFERQVDRLFNQFWIDLPSRAAASSWSSSFQVHTSDDAWRIDIPVPGIDPKFITLESAASTLAIRAEQPSDTTGEAPTRYEQSLSLPQFLDLEKVSASYRHGLLRLTLPLKESVKPRRIQIESVQSEQKQIAA